MTDSYNERDIENAMVERIKNVLDVISNPIGVSSYKIKDYIPENILDKLPTEDDINMHICID